MKTITSKTKTTPSAGAMGDVPEDPVGKTGVCMTQEQLRKTAKLRPMRTKMPRNGKRTHGRY